MNPIGIQIYNNSSLLTPHSSLNKSMAKDNKTNVMRVLEQHGIEYTPHDYPVGEQAPSGGEVAAYLGKDPYSVYKTLVTQGAKGNYVFVIPVCGSLDLKKAAKAAGEKFIEMIPQAKLLPLTGYIHGGCSPIGMKKKLPTFYEEACLLEETVCVSAGKVGFQVELDPNELIRITDGTTADLIM